MKKSVLSLIVGSAMLIAPMTASAMTPMTADNLKDATGQAGVSIALDGIKLESHVGATTYTDTDGYQTLPETAVKDATYAAQLAGWVTAGSDPATKPVYVSTDVNGATSIVIGSKHKVQYINAIIAGRDATATNKGATSANARALTGASYTYTNTMDLGDASATPAVAPAETLFETRALTIDAGTCRLLSEGLKANTDRAALSGGAELAAYAPLAGHEQVAGVVIGLPTIEIHTSADNYDISIANANAVNNGKAFIKITKEASTLAVLGGVLEIAPH